MKTFGEYIHSSLEEATTKKPKKISFNKFTEDDYYDALDEGRIESDREVALKIQQFMRFDSPDEKYYKDLRKAFKEAKPGLIVSWDAKDEQGYHSLHKFIKTKQNEWKQMDSSFTMKTDGFCDSIFAPDNIHFYYIKAQRVVDK